MDFSLVDLIRRLQPALRVRPILVLRHPVDLFFAEFLYKKHCLWRQRGLPSRHAAVELQAWGDLSAQIRGLRLAPGRQLLLHRFLAGTSWASCPAHAPLGSGSRAVPSYALGHADRRLAQRAAPRPTDGGLAALRAQALANAGTYLMVGFMERMPQTLRMLQSLLRSKRWSGFNATALPHVNQLSACVPQGLLSAEGLPSEQQRVEVQTLLRHDVALYDELKRRFEHRFEKMFAL